jgi:hypothetical protein
VTARQASCVDWNRASVEDRLATIGAIRGFEGGSVPGEPGAHGAVLSDHQAYDLFQGWCKQRFARGFKLYKLYARAAPFAAFEAGRPGK